MKRYVSFFFLFCTLALILRTGACTAENARVYPDLIDRTVKADTCADFHFDAGAQLLEIWMPDIRDADAAILMYGGDTWMIDCGDERAAKRLVLLMKQLGIQKIDRLFNSHSKICFVIGGSLGLSEKLIERANERMKLSDLTFLHQMTRLILLEQIYRSFKILNHETYHK